MIRFGCLVLDAAPLWYSIKPNAGVMAVSDQIRHIGDCHRFVWRCGSVAQFANANQVPSSKVVWLSLVWFTDQLIGHSSVTSGSFPSEVYIATTLCQGCCCFFWISVGPHCCSPIRLTALKWMGELVPCNAWFGSTEALTVCPWI